MLVVTLLCVPTCHEKNSHTKPKPLFKHHFLCCICTCCYLRMHSELITHNTSTNKIGIQPSLFGPFVSVQASQSSHPQPHCCTGLALSRPDWMPIGPKRKFEFETSGLCCHKKKIFKKTVHVQEVSQIYMCRVDIDNQLCSSI